MNNTERCSDCVLQIYVFSTYFQPTALTYAVFGFIAVYFAYNIPMIYYYTQDPAGRVASDALAYDRKSKSYVK